MYRMLKVCAFALLFASAVTSAADRPPVVLIDGYHLLCESGASTTDTFGDLESRLRAQGVNVYFFRTCSVPGKPPLEELARNFSRFLDSIPEPTADLVTYSTGGLVLRAYLAGKGDAPGQFNPPANPRIRKWVSIATPNFGALFGGPLADFAPDAQARELVPGSRFLFDLATWNQGHDDLRGIDAIAVEGNAGGFLSFFKGASDGVVSITSASLLFARPDERTRVVPYCHSSSDFAVVLGGGCDAPPIAKIRSADNLTWRIIDSFLSGTDEWKSVGHPPSADPLLARYGGLLVSAPGVNSSTLAFAGQTLSRTATELFSRDFLPAGSGIPAGTYAVLTTGPGLRVDLIAPAAARLPTLSLAPGMIVSIYGSQLANATVTLAGQPVTTLYSSDTQINAILPAGKTGLLPLTVTSGGSGLGLNVYLEPSVPAVFTAGNQPGGAAALLAANGRLVSPENPASPGDYVSLYLTGAAAAQTAEVWLDGVPASVTYTGPAPGFPGLDQINFIVPSIATHGGAGLVVRAGGHTSNQTVLFVR